MPLHKAAEIWQFNVGISRLDRHHGRAEHATNTPKRPEQHHTHVSVSKNAWAETLCVATLIRVLFSDDASQRDAKSRRGAGCGEQRATAEASGARVASRPLRQAEEGKGHVRSDKGSFSSLPITLTRTRLSRTSLRECSESADQAFIHTCTNHGFKQDTKTTSKRAGMDYSQKEGGGGALVGGKLVEPLRKDTIQEVELRLLPLLDIFRR
jgi:hypothetical protein